ncbi:ABC transporter ATP-binding protein [Cryomorpha ignava]|uniref:ABC transporter ATP-binding protein n=1 Tax=Cryomorpha ignava TaxID=101383 RepID=A0A7K3WQH1_9FLAO|nr:ABC transporter ATP-binding protein [Cryomorpha ignava]NEN23910.1 ABC transporter ATP-binding protein [Cryomorpha ignava]
MISIKDISKTFGKQQALKSINLEFKKGECVALIGPNGSGKTTLIKIILGLLFPTSGNLTVNGVNIEKNVDYRADIGYMPQMSRLPENMTVAQVFALMKRLRKDVKELDTDIYEAFDIDGMSKKGLGKLSGGMRQKVSAALAFLFNPDILILDEPTAALDPVSNENLKQKISRVLADGKMVIITSHNLSDLDGIVDRVIYLMDGEVYFDKSIDELRSSTGEERLNKMIVKSLKPQLV